MASDNNLKVDELDFNGIKSNFINYLRNQDEFRDYNFDGSACLAKFPTTTASSKKAFKSMLPSMPAIRVAH